MAKRISYKRFLKLLSQSPRDWGINAISGIHRHDKAWGWQCPWLWVRQSLAKPTIVEKRQAIVDAADHFPGHNKAIRRDLLKACGLTERK